MRVLLALWVLWGIGHVEAQVTMRPPRSLWMLGADLHTRGMGGVVEMFWRRRFSSNAITAFRLTTYKDPREVKISNQSVNRQTLPYVYGKENYVALVTLSSGIRRMIARGDDPMSIAISGIFQGGVVSAILIPVYLEIIHYDPVTREVSYQVERYDPLIHVDQRFIAGGVSWTYGLKEASWMPGLYGQAALQFDLPTYWTLHLAARIGIDLLAFPSELPVMAYVSNDRIVALPFLGIRLFEL